MNSNGTSPYFKLTYGNVQCHFRGNEFGGLSEISTDEPKELDMPLSINGIKACLSGLDDIVKEFNFSCRQIGRKYHWAPVEDDSQIGLLFTQWIETDPIRLNSALNLENLNIKLLPPQIGLDLFPNLEEIYLQGNKLQYLPNTLKLISRIYLETDINKELKPKLPEWWHLQIQNSISIESKGNPLMVSS